MLAAALKLIDFGFRGRTSLKPYLSAAEVRALTQPKLEQISSRLPREESETPGTVSVDAVKSWIIWIIWIPEDLLKIHTCT